LKLEPGRWCRLADPACWALQGVGALSGIGAATSFLAVTGLALYHVLGWWWADRVAAAIAAAPGLAHRAALAMTQGGVSG